jgi:hypothetical protein
MKRWFLAAALLLGGFLGVAQADYIIIIANLGLAPDTLDDLNPGDGAPAPAPPPAVGRPGDGGIVRPGPSGKPNPQPGPGGAPAAQGDSALIVTAVVEVSAVIEQRVNPANPDEKIYGVTHALGGATAKSIFQPTDSIKLIRWVGPNGRPTPGVAQRYAEKKNEADRGTPTVDKYLELAREALKLGLVNECAAAMKKAAELDEKNEKKDATVAVFQKVEEDLKRAPTKADAAEAWHDKLLRNYRITRSAHYALLHTASSDEAPEVRSRLNRLENAFRTFYYWFALQGKALPVPDQRLVAVLALREDDFTNQQRIFDSPPRVADGFYAPHENLLVLSGTCLDIGHHALIRDSKDLWNTFNRDQLLLGKQPKMPFLTSQEEVLKWQQQYLEASTKALFLKALENDSERATISHGATRQLLTAAGLVPRHVDAPEWLQFGMGSFFEIPKGAPWPSIGAPSATFNDPFNYLLQYRKMTDKDRKLDKKALLENIVTDRLFHQAMTGKKEIAALLQARATAWALTYFLAHRQLDDLLGYYQELARMPRDLEFDDEALLDCFGRAFKLMDDRQPTKRDPNKFSRLAAEFHEFVRLTSVEPDPILEQVQKVQNELRGNPNPKP